jgi:hypothetical protein
MFGIDRVVAAVAITVAAGVCVWLYGLYKFEAAAADHTASLSA